jgi:hypothetical protein
LAGAHRQDAFLLWAVGKMCKKEQGVE